MQVQNTGTSASTKGMGVMCMSFSSRVKQEISQIAGPRHCKIAEISAIIDICGMRAGQGFEVRTENPLIKSKFLRTVEADFGGDAAGLLMACKARGLVVKSECCKRAYVRSAFICSGTMADPQKAYHMEIGVDAKHIDNLSSLFDFFGLAPKIHLRRQTHILYFKEAEQIATILNIIGAHVALMEFENYRAHKDVNNAINRVSNAAAANEDKVIRASAKHIVDIMDIQKTAGMSALNDNLVKVAQLRLDNPLASLEDIGKMLTPPISKSGVNHRLKKIGEIAESYRTEAYKND